MTLTRKIANFIREPLIEKTETMSHWYWLLKTQFYYRHFFRRIGPGSRIIKPLRLKNVENMSIGSGVIIHKHCWLQTEPNPAQRPELVVGDGSIIGNFNHITCVERVIIEDRVLTADGVFISDHGHAYQNPDRPILEQGITAGKPVVIGRGSWIGENAAIMSCRIGRNCVIGANSVVLNDVPDHSVAVGAPARIVRRLNQHTNLWERVSAADS